ncbi:hypothetical protein VTI74DRAFT_2460 [Chaetomium olivicolor]
MVDSQIAFSSLPNELLISILSHLSTADLLHLTAVSRRFFSATVCIVKQRLNHTTSQPDHRIILEVYHPSEKLYTPYMYCEYLHTDSFGAIEAELEAAEHTAPSAINKLSNLRNVYAHYRPRSLQEENHRRPVRLPGRWSSPGNALEEEEEKERPTQDIYLEGDEDSSELCTIANLVRMGPKLGLFRRHVNVVDGVIRVWRHWLAAQSERGGAGQDDAVLWADAERTVGVRFRVTEKDIRLEHPVLVGSDEELPVAYRLKFEELLVRVTTVLVKAEESEVQNVASEGKAVVVAF